MLAELLYQEGSPQLVEVTPVTPPWIDHSIAVWLLILLIGMCVWYAMTR